MYHEPGQSRIGDRDREPDKNASRFPRLRRAISDLRSPGLNVLNRFSISRGSWTPLLPDLLPPFFIPAGGAEIHFLIDLLDVPAGETGEIFRLGPISGIKRLKISSGRVAFCFASPRVPENVPSLKVGAITGLLESQILREMRRIVAQVKPGYEHIGACVRPRNRAVDTRFSGGRVDVV